MIQNDTQAVCVCEPGWAGLYCEQDIPECNSNPCQNGATCVELTPPNIKCTCPEGYTGVNCDILQSVCQTKRPCQNGAICLDTTNSTDGYTCMCMAGYSGNTCRMLIDVCSSSPCANGGLCTPIGPGQYSCLCLPGWVGPACEERFDACASQPCLNGGSCVCHEGSYSCQCAVGK